MVGWKRRLSFVFRVADWDVIGIRSIINSFMNKNSV